MKVLYDQVMLALSYMQKNMAIRNWVQHIMNTINGMVSVARFSPIPVTSERLWGEFQVEFETAFTNTTKLQDAEAVLEHICIQQGENIDQYITCFEDLMDKAGWQHHQHLLMRVTQAHAKGHLYERSDPDDVHCLERGHVQGSKPLCPHEKCGYVPKARP